ncbi:MAG TPA: hypothetical protein VMD78_10650 [Candidatus Baltobacteraceae bacterium]|nr:hypothetical protein [Candidatus Baltobacteraceae bacterium]
MHELVWHVFAYSFIGGSVYLLFHKAVFAVRHNVRRKLIGLGSVSILLLLSSGCNATTTAQDFANVITGILNIAKAEIPALPPADGAIVAQWTTLGATLDGQLQSCIAAATSAGGRKTAFLACFNTFAQGLMSTSELAQLRVLSSGSQSKVQLWVTAVSLGINAALSAFGGAAQPAPSVSAQQPTKAELLAFARAHSLPSDGL